MKKIFFFGYESKKSKGTIRRRHKEFKSVFFVRRHKNKRSKELKRNGECKIRINKGTNFSLRNKSKEIAKSFLADIHKKKL